MDLDEFSLDQLDEGGERSPGVQKDRASRLHSAESDVQHAILALLHGDQLTAFHLENVSPDAKISWLQSVQGIDRRILEVLSRDVDIQVRTALAAYRGLPGDIARELFFRETQLPVLLAIASNDTFNSTSYTLMLEFLDDVQKLHQASSSVYSLVPQLLQALRVNRAIKAFNIDVPDTSEAFSRIL